MNNTKVIVGFATLALGAAGAQAGIVGGPLTLPIGGGWEVIISDASHVQITPLNPATALQDGAVHITKAAQFTDIDEFTGAPSGLTITFHQIAPDAQTVSQIIIDAEFISNLTGMNWVAFDQILALSGAATFSPVSLGMNVGPQFAGNSLSGNGRTFTSSGGPGVPSGGLWTPGGPQSAPLIINVDLSQDTPITFVLKEMPRVPAPGAAALLAIGSAGFLRRRRA